MQLAQDARQGVSLKPADSQVDAVAGSRIAGDAGGFPSSPGHKELGYLATALARCGSAASRLRPRRLHRPVPAREFILSLQGGLDSRFEYSSASLLRFAKVYAQNVELFTIITSK
jgi:hypothetical protein